MEMKKSMREMPTVMVAFGVTGDLMRIKVIPALFALHVHGDLPEKFCLVGFSRRDWGDADFREYVREIITWRSDRHTQRVAVGPPHAAAEKDIASFLNLLKFQSGDFSDKESYAALKRMIDGVDASWGVCTNKIFYFAVAPNFYEPIIADLASSGLSEGCSPEEGWSRVIVEKPFGHDGESAAQLESLLARDFKEEQIYRIDHYLGKAVLQDVFDFRFDDGSLEAAWDAKHIESITIRALETLGAEKRGAFYDSVGALRDVGQNHSLATLSLLTMDRPSERTADAIREERGAALEALEIIPYDAMASETFRAQYDGFREIRGVAPDSNTETYFKICASLRSARWHGVPIIIEAGKRLAVPEKEVVVRFKDGSLKRFDFNTAVQYTEEYERLLLDAIRGDQTRFVSRREIEAAWRFVDPIERAWRAGAKLVPLHRYAPGTSDITRQADF